MAARGEYCAGQPHVIAPNKDLDLWMAFFTDPDGNTLALMQEAPKFSRPSPITPAPTPTTAPTAQTAP